jgi:hypothetical protein
MNSPLENRKVRLRGLGGRGVCGGPGTCASATGAFPRHARAQSAKADFLNFQPRFQPPGQNRPP